MNPNIDKMPLPEMSLPGLTNGVAMSGGENQPNHPETANVESGMPSPRTPEMSNPITSMVSPVSLPMQPVSAAPQTTIKQGAATAAQLADIHDIEKEYVTKAKVIIEQTKTDPYIQSKELSRVKAEFIKKQYGKDIKLSER